MGSTPIVIQQLLWQLPGLLVYLVGFILAIVFYNRAPRAAMLTMFGTGILLIVAIGFPFLQMYLINQRAPGGGGNWSTMMSFVSIGASVMRAIGTALIIAGVFVGRKPEMAGFPMAQVVPPLPGRY